MAGIRNPIATASPLMDDEDELDGVLGEFGLDGGSRPPGGDDLMPRLDESDELGDWNDYD